MWTLVLIGKARRMRRSGVSAAEAVLSLGKPRHEVEEAYYATLRHESDETALSMLTQVLIWQAQGVPLVNGRPMREVEPTYVNGGNARW